MPNWCSNEVTIHGPADAVAGVAAVVSPQGQTTCEQVFSRWLPMPEPLQEIHRGACSIGGVVVRSWRTELDADGAAVNVALTPEDLADLTARYGTADWYDWALRHWGCKWDTDAEVTISPEQVVLHFDTPWGPPEAFLDYLSAALDPRTRIELAYSEGGVGYWGRTVWQAGVRVSQDFHDGPYWDHDEPQPEVAQFLDRHGLHTGG